jgi:AcrR family transcriptional regulator
MKQNRNPDHTRQTILDAAAQEIHLHGFQAASLSRILATTGLTKGALYHHFPNKQALGYAVLEEVIFVRGKETWIGPLESCADPVDCLQEMMAARFKDMTRQELLLGCPLNNLALEMSPIDEGFRRRVQEIYDRWTQALATILARGQGSGSVCLGVDPFKVATFIVASIAGIRSLAKTSQNHAVLEASADALIGYLETLRG